MDEPFHCSSVMKTKTKTHMKVGAPRAALLQRGHHFCFYMLRGDLTSQEVITLVSRNSFQGVLGLEGYTSLLKHPCICPLVLLSEKLSP